MEMSAGPARGSRALLCWARLRAHGAGTGRRVRAESFLPTFDRLHRILFYFETVMVAFS